MGSLLRLPRVAFTSADELKAPGLRHAVAATRGGQDYRTFDWSPPLVLWLGDERGTTSLAPPPDALPVTIPLHGPTESLNAATAAALLLFEAARSGR
jgi:TrmH family RNA methyltransferase